MDISIAYKIARLVTDHKEAEATKIALERTLHQYSFNDPEGTNEVQLEYSINGVDNDTFELLTHQEIINFQKFLVETATTRMLDIEDRIKETSFIELREGYVKVVRIPYAEVVYNVPNPADIEGLTLEDLPLSKELLQEADEIYVVHGDHEYRLKPELK